MPAVLVEMGFLSHAPEELQLGERSYQRLVARAIGEAVLAFRDQAATPAAGPGSAP
jgi:N-acetylmuramoyl-L-alanine amidase